MNVPILYIDRSFENNVVRLVHHFEDDSEIEVQIPEELYATPIALLLVTAEALHLTVDEVLKNIIHDGKEEGDRWWTPLGLKWREGFNALEERYYPKTKEGPDSDRPGDVRPESPPAA